MTDRKVIAEIGSCGGDLQLAIDTAQAALEAGAWLVKGQGYRADTLVTKGAPTYGKGLGEPATQYEAFSKALTQEEWEQVAAVVPGQFALSIFDEEWLDGYPWGYLKIASADITYKPLIEKAAATGANLIMSTGASTVEEINRALGWCGANKPTLMVCTLAYPTEPEDANVARVKTMLATYPHVGYSDHTRGVYAAALAFEYGAQMVEKHFTIRPGEGGDHDFGITPDELTALVNGAAGYEEDPIPDRDLLAGSPVIRPYDAEYAARTLARRGVYAAVDIPAGSIITRDQLAFLRPATNIAPWMVDTLNGSPVGALAHDDIPADTALSSLLFSLTIE